MRIPDTCDAHPKTTRPFTGLDRFHLGVPGECELDGVIRDTKDV
jgi:hypothetical protein